MASKGLRYIGRYKKEILVPFAISSFRFTNSIPGKVPIKCEQEAQEFVQGFLKADLATFEGKELTETDDFIVKYFNANRFTHISGGNIIPFQDYISFHNGYVKLVKEATASIKVLSWMSHSIATSYTYDISDNIYQ